MLAALRPHHLHSFVPTLWEPAGCTWEITALLAPSLILWQIGVAVMLESLVGFCDSSARGRQGDLLLVTLPPRTPLTGSSQVSFT